MLFTKISHRGTILINTFLESNHMNIIKSIFSIFSHKEQPVESDFDAELHSIVIEEYSDFNDITKDFMDYVKSQYEIEFESILADGFHTKTDTTYEPCFVKKYVLESGENLWFMMIYDSEQMEVSSLHLFGASGGYNETFDKEFVLDWKNRYKEREVLELELSRKLANRGNLAKV